MQQKVPWFRSRGACLGEEQVRVCPSSCGTVTCHAGTEAPANCSCPVSLQFITDVTLIIIEADYKDPRRLMKFLQLYSPEKKGGCYKVRGTFEEVEELSIKLSALRHLSPVTRGGVCLQDEEDPVHVRAVDVSSVVMAYIVQKCAEKFNKIRDNAFVTVTHSQLRTVNDKQSVTEQVIFRPRHVSVNRVHVDLVRQQFITFYQRTASDLQVTSVPLSPHEDRDLQKKFPRVLFKPSHSSCEVTATGPFVHIAQLKKFLSQNTQSSSGSPVNRGPVNTASRETSDPSAACRKDPEDESCPICMEPIETSDRETLPCKHSFCTNCLKKAFDYKPVCPTCGELYGMLTGTQPEGGKMNISKTSTSLPGYERYGTIVIRYNIPSGIQKVRSGAHTQ